MRGFCVTCIWLRFVALLCNLSTGDRLCSSQAKVAIFYSGWLVSVRSLYQRITLVLKLIGIYVSSDIPEGKDHCSTQSQGFVACGHFDSGRPLLRIFFIERSKCWHFADRWPRIHASLDNVVRMSKTNALKEPSGYGVGVGD